MLREVISKAVTRVKTSVVFLGKIRSLKILRNESSDYYGEVGYACPKCKHPNSYRKMACGKCGQHLRCNHCYSLLVFPGDGCPHCDRDF
jgi:hypothetical protein